MEVVVITGPTASGKSALAVRLAQLWGCHIISADSRQVFRAMPITTAVPTLEERGGVPHHLLEFLDPSDYYSAACFEADALRIIDSLTAQGHERVIVCGGSMMYIDALTRGLDALPTITDAVRQQCLQLFEAEGIEGIRQRLLQLDPEYLAEADPNNHRRLVHALEIITESGQKVSQLRTGQAKPRPFTVRKYAITMPREQLFDRINRRVEQMDAQGLEQEARRLYPLRHLNSLNTVGFKEMFAYFDGRLDRPTALSRLAKNTRVYAKKQLTWLARDPEIIPITDVRDLTLFS